MDEKILMKVQKPSRYSGGEYNTAATKRNAPLTFAMCFPDVYESAMSNLGIKILYHMLNERKDTSCELCFAPWGDMGEALKKADEPLFSLQTKTPLADFDMVGFSLQYEMMYTTVLYMLELARIPLLSRDRGEDSPIVIAGGPCTVNPAPILDFFDLVVVGDGEEVTNELCDLWLENKKAGGTKSDFLKKAACIQGVYANGYSENVKKAIVENLDKAFYPLAPIVAGAEAVHDRGVLEIFRGCTRGCRFCQAGFIYRPIRERRKETLEHYAREIIHNTGYDELSLSSLSTCDYSDLRELLKSLKEFSVSERINLALPSLRMDSFEAEFTDTSRLSSLTFAPEAGSQRLRDVINKNITDEDILSSLEAAFRRGYTKVKLYYMMGLPTETDEDIEGIEKLCIRIKKLYSSCAPKKGGLSLGVSTSVFIPKPFTPFQWCAFLDRETVMRRQNMLKFSLRKLGIKYNWHDYSTSVLEAIFARGDKALGKVLLRACESGMKFDGWSEYFDFERWTEVFSDCGVDMDNYLKELDMDSPLAWDFVDVGVSKKYLSLEMERALKAKTTSDCRQGCTGCGLEKCTMKIIKN